MFTSFPLLFENVVVARLPNLKIETRAVGDLLVSCFESSDNRQGSIVGSEREADVGRTTALSVLNCFALGSKLN